MVRLAKLVSVFPYCFLPATCLIKHVSPSGLRASQSWDDTVFPLHPDGASVAHTAIILQKDGDIEGESFRVPCWPHFLPAPSERGQLPQGLCQQVFFLKLGWCDGLPPV